MRYDRLMADILYADLDTDSEIGFVRSLIPDIEQLSNPIDPTEADSYLFDDKTLERFLAMSRGRSPKRAAALACDALSSSELLILKKITTDDLATDGPSVAREFGAKAIRLRADANLDEAADDDGSPIITAGFFRRPPLYDAEKVISGGRY